MKKLGLIIVFLLLLCGCGQTQSSEVLEPMLQPVQEQTEEVKEEKAEPVKQPIQTQPPQVKTEPDSVAEEMVKEPTCSITIDCKTVLGHFEKLAEEKKDWIPKDGVILPLTTVEIYEGDTAFSVLNRITREKKIHLEFVETPMYQSAYIEGIGNLYEFDCGESSGWLYLVNGKIPSYGCSQYQVQEGDVIAFRYSLNFGADIV